MRIHTFDTCALSDLAELSEYGLARHRLLDEVAAGRILVLGTMPLLWELPGLHGANLSLFEAFFDLLLRITRGRVLLNPVVRQESEVRASKAPVLVLRHGYGVTTVRNALDDYFAKADGQASEPTAKQFGVKMSSVRSTPP